MGKEFRIRYDQYCDVYFIDAQANGFPNGVKLKKYKGSIGFSVDFLHDLTQTLTEFVELPSCYRPKRDDQLVCDLYAGISEQEKARLWEAFRIDENDSVCPEFMVAEAVRSCGSAFKWACRHTKTPADILVQMRAMLLPTINHPDKPGHKISPLEMLGYGDMGDIERIIARSPDEINGRRVIRQATKDNPEIVEPRFAKLWLSRELEGDEYMAPQHPDCAGDIYLEIGRFFVEAAETLYKRKPLRAKSFLMALMPK